MGKTTKERGHAIQSKGLRFQVIIVLQDRLDRHTRVQSKMVSWWERGGENNK